MENSKPRNICKHRLRHTATIAIKCVEHKFDANKNGEEKCCEYFGSRSKEADIDCVCVGEWFGFW